MTGIYQSIVERLLLAARYLVPLLILGFLFRKLWLDDADSIQALYSHTNNWPQLCAAIAIYLSSVTITIFRWYLLVIALKLPFTISDALRLGFIGYLLQFVSLGSVGGDVFKAVFIAREQPSRKPEAVATILVDRLIGLFGLTILACIGFAALRQTELGKLSIVRTTCLALAAVGTLAMSAAFLTNWSLQPFLSRVRRFNFVRGALIRVQAALDLYRQHRHFVFVAVLLAVLSHFMHSLAIFLAATSVFPDGPNLRQQVVLWVVAGTVAAIPVAPAGLGTFDYAYKALYESISPTLEVTNEGFLVALLYRVMCLIAAAIGVIYFWTSRRQLRSIDDDVEAETPVGSS